MTEAMDLLHKLQIVIEDKDKEIRKLKSLIHMLKTHNEQLRNEMSAKNHSLKGSLGPFSVTKQQ